MKNLVLFSLIIICAPGFIQAQELDTVKLNAPDKNRGLTVMQAMSVRASGHEWSDQKLSHHPVCSGDFRSLPGMTPAPVNLVLISDISLFSRGEDSLKLTWAAMDAGIVSQNISVFCAGTKLVTRPRANFPGMDKMKETLKLKDTQHVMLNHPVGYPKEQEK